MKSPEPYPRTALYRYNPHTCRYERARRSAADLIAYISGVFGTATLLLAGMLVVHNAIVESGKEKLLRKENHALEKSERIISKKLQDIDAVFVSLDDKDRQLHEKFFGALDHSPSAGPLVSDQHMLLGDAEDAEGFIRNISGAIGKLLGANTQEGMREDLLKNRKFLTGVPAGLPVRTLVAENIFSGFGSRVHPFHKGLYHHPGIDISLPRGTEILSTGDGTVTTAKISALQAGYGNYVEVDHGNGFITRYAHLEAVLVRKGQVVSRGDVLGTSGSSGGSVSPHLHYEILRDGHNTNPIGLMIQGVDARTFEKFRQAANRQNQSLD